MVGSLRIWEDLRYAGERCRHQRVAQLMRRAGLRGVPQRRRWRKKPTGTRPSGTRNHLERDFTAAAPNTKWVTDIIYIRTAEHWLYLCVVLDLYPGLVVGWSMSPHQDRQQVVQALLMALRNDRLGCRSSCTRIAAVSLRPRNTNDSWRRTTSPGA